MALRVLLADESTTIKKVMQLALQEYGVDVKSVPVGLDVIPVSKSFKPDIIFVDVLLQKKSGYEVAKDVKLDPSLRETPVVLMWSGFMELDETKVVDSKVDGRLEKPFDADTLRSLIKDLVPRTTESRVSSYLTFPKLPDFDEEPVATPAQTSTPTANAAPRTETNPSIPRPPESGANPVFKIDTPTFETETGSTFAGPSSYGGESQSPFGSDNNSPFGSDTNSPFGDAGTSKTDDIFSIPEVAENDIFAMDAGTDPDDQFRTVPLNMAKDPPPAGDEIWTHQDLSKFKLQVPSAESELTAVTPGGAEFEKFLIPGEEMNLAQVETTGGEFEEITFNAPPARKPATPTPPEQTARTQMPRTETVTQSNAPNRSPDRERERGPERRQSPPPEQTRASDFNSDEMPRANPRAVSTAMDQVLAEKILREEANAVLEKVLWQILPDICERVVKEELNKLLKDVERSI